MLAQGRAFLLEEMREFFDFWLMSGYGAIYRVTERSNQKKEGEDNLKPLRLICNFGRRQKVAWWTSMLVNGGASAGEILLGV